MRSLLAVFLTFFSAQIFATNRIDSVGVESNNGNQVIIHKVEPKESYYSIGRKYQVLPKDLIAYNNNIPLKIGVLIKVPTSRNLTLTARAEALPKDATKTLAVVANPVKPNNSVTETVTEIFEYKVGPKETLYAIAKKFGTTIGELKKLNNLPGYSLSIGQIIKIKPGAQPVEIINPVVEPLTTANEDIEEEKPKIPTGRLGLAERSEKGVAVWIDDENLDSKKMLALHRTAPIGTVVKVTNPMTERTTFAKVVGKYTENETTRDVIIVLTKATADLLGALDKRFQVTIDYGVPHE